MCVMRGSWWITHLSHVDHVSTIYLSYVAVICLIGCHPSFNSSISLSSILLLVIFFHLRITCLSFFSSLYHVCLICHLSLSLSTYSILSVTSHLSFIHLYHHLYYIFSAYIFVYFITSFYLAYLHV